MPQVPPAFSGPLSVEPRNARSKRMMRQQRQQIKLVTEQPLELIDISAQVRGFFERNAIEAGLLHVASQHTTLAVAVNERCEALQQDMLNFLQDLAPAQRDYRHNRIAVDGRPNAHSHLLALLIPSQVSLIVADGRLELGQWQSVFAVELDGPRPERNVTLTLIGE